MSDFAILSFQASGHRTRISRGAKECRRRSGTSMYERLDLLSCCGSKCGPGVALLPASTVSVSRAGNHAHLLDLDVYLWHKDILALTQASTASDVHWVAAD